MYYPESHQWPEYGGNPIPKRLVYSPYFPGSYAYADFWGYTYPRAAIVKLTAAEALGYGVRDMVEGKQRYQLSDHRHEYRRDIMGHRQQCDWL